MSDMRRFHNALRILWNIDKHEFLAAGGHEGEWAWFRDSPHKFFIRARDELATGLWTVIESRQPSGDSPMEELK